MNSTNQEPRYLEIPTIPATWIPLGMSQDDFNLVMATINLWQSRIAPSTPEQPITDDSK